MISSTTISFRETGKYTDMDKDRISRLISFDDGGDTSTGFVDVSDMTNDDRIYVFRTPWEVIDFFKRLLKYGNKNAPGIKSVRKGMSASFSKFVGRVPCIDIQYYPSANHTQFQEISLREQSSFDSDFEMFLMKIQFSTVVPYSLWEKLADLSGRIKLNFEISDFI